MNVSTLTDIYKSCTHHRFLAEQYLWHMRILMVCLGNICRSPLAEAILQEKANAAGLHWEVDSAGTGNYHIGEKPHQLSQKVALHNGIDISAQRCRQFTKEDIRNFDLIYVMDADNYTDVKRICGEYWDAAKVTLILEGLYPGEEKEVPDPWYGTEKDFHIVFGLLSRACDAIIDRYRNS